MKNITSLLLLLSLFFFCCKNENPNNIPPKSNLTSSILKEINNPVKKGGEPNLFTSQSGKVYMSWVEYIDSTTDALLFTQLIDNQWTAPKEVARGNNWFVNWADFPSVVTYKNNDQYLAAHWLQKRADGTYDYDIYVSQSKDGGNTWYSPFIIHSDGIAAEHGFVTLLPTDDNKIFATWLDGRNTKIDKTENHDNHDDHGHGHGGGAMTLRTASFDINGKISDEAELDNRICDCCQTTATFVNGNPIVAYRDRSEEEIRDIFFTKKTNGKWSTPKAVHQDNWKIAGCPVNGPFIASAKNQTAIVWYTAAKEPTVNIAFFNPKENAFDTPIRIDDGKPLGRVGIVMLENISYVTWIEEIKDDAAIRLTKVSREGKQGNSFTIAETAASRSSGFPQIEFSNNQFIFAWTVEEENSSTIKTAYIDLNNL